MTEKEPKVTVEVVAADQAWPTDRTIPAVLSEGKDLMEGFAQLIFDPSPCTNSFLH